jgi:addiction module HigA family antidote
MWTAQTLKQYLRITRVTLSRVLNGKAGIPAAMANRLAAALGTTPELWMNMESPHDRCGVKTTRSFCRI